MESSSFECITCKLNITGFTNFQRHVNSIEHANYVRMKISNNETDEEKVLTSDCEEPTSTLNQYSPPSFSSVGLACELCQKRFSGTEPYQQHLASAGHKKKVESLTNPNSQLRCDICDKDFSGTVPYEQHIVSKVHLKKALFNDMEQKSFPAFLAEHQIGGKSNYDSPPMGNEGNVNSKVNGSSLNNSFPKPVATEVTIPASVVASQLLLSCDVCDKRFSGPVPYQQHMDSQIHKKKEQEKEMLKRIYSASNRCEVISASNQDKIDGINKSGIGSSCLENDLIKSPLSATSQVHPFRCADCDKNFTGPVPYDQHMVSAMHLKKMFQKKPMNEETDHERKFPVTPLKCEIPNSERYFCKICDKQCTGSIPFAQHNLSEAHCKKVQVLKFKVQELNDLSKRNDSDIDDDQMSTDDNYAIELSKKSSLFSKSSELSFNDILKEVNHVTPDNLNVPTFRVGDSIEF